MRIPEGWSEDQVTDLHPTFAAKLIPVVLEAQAAGLPVRRASGYRSNAKQKALHEERKAQLAAYAKDPSKFKARPLPAAPAGKSAHNYALCSTDPTHKIGGASECPTCGAATTPASLAADVMILDPITSQAIPTGGDLPLDQRDGAWRQWARILDAHPELRDGGDFRPRAVGGAGADTPHVEDAGWASAAQTYTESPPPAPMLKAIPVAAAPAAAADTTAVAAPAPRRRRDR